MIYMSKTVLVLGASGMLGHKVMQILANKKMSVIGTIRGSPDIYKNTILENFALVGGVHGDSFYTIERAVNMTNPDYIINCIGIIKQLEDGNNALKCLKINAMLPHQLDLFTESRNIKLIHVSTDCVFDGARGNYTENDVPNATDIYGISKLAGEVNSKTNLTLRTSIIGREIYTQHGLLEWFLSQKGKKIQGYTNAKFSGVTTNELSNVINIIINDFPHISGIYNISSSPISKYDLLTKINNYIGRPVEIEKYDGGENLDRTLDSTNFKNYYVPSGWVQPIRYAPPSWDEMIAELFKDTTPYDEMRASHA